MDDILCNKVQIIERCLQRIDEEYGGNADNLKNFTKQDSIILNIQRACEAAIDLGMHIVAREKFGLPGSARGQALRFAICHSILWNRKVLYLMRGKYDKEAESTL